MSEILLVHNLRIIYEPHWVDIVDGKVTYDYSEIAASHEIKACYLPVELYQQLLDFVEGVERAHDEAG